MIGFIKSGLFLLLFIILFLMLSGCSALGLDLTEQRTYAITKPPYQIIVSGDLTNADSQAVGEIVGQLSKYPYQEYKFNENINVNVIGSETMVENVSINNSEPKDEK